MIHCDPPLTPPSLPLFFGRVVAFNNGYQLLTAAIIRAAVLTISKRR